MTLQDFNKYAKEEIDEYGIPNTALSVMACIFNSENVCYTIRCWDDKTKKHIRSSQPNPSSSLVEFKDKLKAHFKDYSKEIKDMDLTYGGNK
jgi:hypothetical protein